MTFDSGARWCFRHTDTRTHAWDKFTHCKGKVRCTCWHVQLRQMEMICMQSRCVTVFLPQHSPCLYTLFDPHVSLSNKLNPKMLKPKMKYWYIINIRHGINNCYLYEWLFIVGTLTFWVLEKNQQFEENRQSRTNKWQSVWQ